MFTYDDVIKVVKDSGVSISDYALKAAQSNPDKVMSIINAKINFGKSKTPQEQAYWHGIAESNRGDIGYSGGKYGGDYISLSTPSSYSPATKTPTYENQYADQIQSALSNIQNKKAWSYNADSDQAYQAAKKQYMREADRASADTMGQYASMTGGMPSTAAMTAGSQASDYYKTQLSDQLGNYINQDYQRYIDQLGADYDKLSALSSLEQGDYGKYQDQLGQHNTENAFSYQQFLDNYDANKAQDQTKYDREQGEYEKSQYEKEYSNQQLQYRIETLLALYDATGDSSYRKQAEQLLSTLK